MNADLALKLVVQTYRGRVDLWEIHRETVEFINSAKPPVPMDNEDTVLAAILKSMESASFFVHPEAREFTRPFPKFAAVNPVLLQLDGNVGILLGNATKADFLEHKRFMAARDAIHIARIRKEMAL